MRRWYRTAALRFALALPPLVRLLPVTGPMRQLWHAGPIPKADLVVFLPGIDDMAGDFELHGLVPALRSRRPMADAVEVDAHLGYYLRRNLEQRLHEDLFLSERVRRYRRRWLVGVSLGGLGVLRYAAQFGDELAGLVLIAPFLGRAHTADMVRPAGGVLYWELPPAERGVWERSVWEWVRHQGALRDGPELWLAYGNQDPLAPANRLLAEALPSGRVVSLDGGHDWPTWRRLWVRMLGAGLMAGAS